MVYGDLIIRGDELDNSITIEPGAEEGQYVVTGNDTTINGGEEPIVVEADVLIFMGEGADVVIEPHLPHITYGDFHHAEQCISQGALATQNSIPEIKRLLAA